MNYKILLVLFDFGALAMIGGSLISGLLGAKNTSDVNKTNQALSTEQARLQTQFAKHGISWKVSDAKRAGIHPLYALGANTVSYQPQSIATQPKNYDFIERMGQNVKGYLEKKDKWEELEKIARINLLHAQATALRSTGNSDTPEPINPITDTPTQDKILNTTDPTGSTEKGIEPFDRWTKKDGWVFKIPTQMNQELITEMNPVQFRYYRDWSKMGFSALRLKYGAKTEEGRNFRDWLIRYQRPPLTPEMQKNNMEWRYKETYGFKAVKKHSIYDSYFYVDKRYNIPNNNMQYHYKPTEYKKGYEWQKDFYDKSKIQQFINR